MADFRDSTHEMEVEVEVDLPENPHRRPMTGHGAIILRLGHSNLMEHPKLTQAHREAKRLVRKERDAFMIYTPKYLYLPQGYIEGAVEGSDDWTFVTSFVKVALKEGTHSQFADAAQVREVVSV